MKKWNKNCHCAAIEIRLFNKSLATLSTTKPCQSKAKRTSSASATSPDESYESYELRHSDLPWRSRECGWEMVSDGPVMSSDGERLKCRHSVDSVGWT